MIENLASHFGTQIETFLYLMMLINGILHLIFAGAVAHDAGKLTRLSQRPVLVSGTTWAFATLIGGVMVAGLYWILNHSTLTRVTSS